MSLRVTTVACGCQVIPRERETRDNTERAKQMSPSVSHSIQETFDCQLEVFEIPSLRLTRVL